MVIAVVVLGVVVLVVSVRGLRRPSPGKGWPEVTAGVLAGLVVALGVGGALVALAVGRTTWNAWTAGTPSRESVTLSVLVVGFPLLLALAALSLVVGRLGARRRRRLETRSAHRGR